MVVWSECLLASIDFAGSNVIVHIMYLFWVAHEILRWSETSAFSNLQIFVSYVQSNVFCGLEICESDSLSLNYLLIFWRTFEDLRNYLQLIPDFMKDLFAYWMLLFGWHQFMLRKVRLQHFATWLQSLVVNSPFWFLQLDCLFLLLVIFFET